MHAIYMYIYVYAVRKNTVIPQNLSKYVYSFSNPSAPISALSFLHQLFDAGMMVVGDQLNYCPLETNHDGNVQRFDLTLTWWHVKVKDIPNGAFSHG